MSKSLSIAIALAVGLAAGSPAAFAAPCKDARGQFIKCQPASQAKSPKSGKSAKCKDAKGKFAKCGGPGAKPGNQRQAH